MRPTITKTQQQGFSLISMMVGTIISMLTIAASFILFQQTSNRANNLNTDMQLEGQMATILTTIQLETQSAGFGINDPISENATGAFFSRTNSGMSEIYWRFVDVGVQCRSFVEVQDGTTVEMQWREPADATQCTVDSNFLTGITSWKVIEIAARFERTTGSLISFSTSDSNCWPYNQGIESSHTKLTVTGTSSVESETHSFTYCLTNL
ncbi:PilW family protein [Marinicellulosiphila megalodicopiae]|uniref:PilW family protein n=1 Tax=Marinicellulosiphila megalodicopiae TaxID=2724896 RepID=UPI003BB0376A